MIVPWSPKQALAFLLVISPIFAFLCYPLFLQWHPTQEDVDKIVVFSGIVGLFVVALWACSVYETPKEKV